VQIRHVWANFTGSIPTTLGLLSDLTNVTLVQTDGDHAGLTGAIPSQVGNLSKLAALALNGRSLTGAVPSQLGRCSLLGLLDLSGNNNGLGGGGSLPPEVSVGRAGYACISNLFCSCHRYRICSISILPT
jgi:hypothetical protein